MMSSFMVCTSHQIFFRVFNSSRMKWVEQVASVVKRRGAYRVLVGKPEGNKSLGTPRHTGG